MHDPHARAEEILKAVAKRGAFLVAGAPPAQAERMVWSTLGLPDALAEFDRLFAEMEARHAG